MSTAQTAEKTFTSQMLDEEGNSLFIVSKLNIIVIYLRLKSESRKRKIGFVNTNTRTLHITRKRWEHLFRKTNSYGFCYHIIKDAKRFNQIELKDEYDRWRIPTSFILDKQNAKYLHFKEKGGFELQIFIPLCAIEQFKRPERF